MLFNNRAEGLTYFLVHFLAAAGTQRTVREVGVHTTTIPIQCTQWFTSPVNSQTIFFANTLQQVAGQPNLVTSFFCSFRKNLELPLSGCHFCIDTFYVQTCFN